MIKNIITTTALVCIAVFVVSTVVLVANQASVAEASFHTGEGGSGGGTGSTGGDGCGGCHSGDDPTPTPTPTPTPICDVSLSLATAKVGDTYKITWNGTPGSGSFKMNGNAVADSGNANFTFVGPNYERFTFTGVNGSKTCSKTVEITKTPEETTPICDVSLSLATAKVGDTYKITWNGTPGSGSFKMNGNAVADSGNANFTFVGPNYERFTFTGVNGSKTCSKTVEITKTPEETTPICDVSLSLATAKVGDTYKITWNGTPGSGSFKMNGNAVADSGNANFTFVGPNYERFTFTGVNGSKTCSKTVEITKTPEETTPICDVSLSLATAKVGDTYKITWNGTPGSGSFKMNGNAVADSGNANFTFVGPNYERFTFTGVNGSKTCSKTVEITKKPDTPAPSCDSFTGTPTTLPYGGGTVNLKWLTSNATDVSINQGVGPVSADGNKNVTVTNTITYTLTAKKAGFPNVQCPVKITVKQDTVAPSCDSFTGTPTSLPYGGGNVTLKWNTSNADSVSISQGIGSVSADNTTGRVENVTETITYVLTAKKAGFANAYCPVKVTVLPREHSISCQDVVFDSAPSSPVTPGTSVNLSWVFTGNVSSATINNGVGDAFARNNVDVVINNTTTFTATIANATSHIDCPYTITTRTVVDDTPAISIIKRDAADKDDTQTVSVGGTATFEIVVTNTGDEDLVNVVVTDPRESNCNLNIGNLAIGATHPYTCQSTNVQSNFTNVANVTGNSAVDNQVVNDTDPTNVTVPTSNSYSCENNVDFKADDYSLPRGGGNVLLTWVTTGLDSISINGVASSNLSDNETVRVRADITYTLRGLRNGVEIYCPISIDVASGGGGGGGGSSSPRCDLDISDEKIKIGEEVTLKWDTSRSSEVKITDNHGNVLLDSDDSDDLDGKMTIKPTKDTEFTLLSIKGSRERKCKVEVEVENKITVIESRSQDPRVAGISLTQVPYTGFEAGPALTMIFYALLTIWGLFVAYIFAVRRDFIGGVSLAGAHDHVSYTDMSTNQAVEDVEAETEAESYVHAVAHTEAPVNLPIATPVIGYAAAVETDEIDESIEMTELENRAHAQRVLLSSDAMRFFMNATEAGETRNEKLDAAIAQAKASFPSEGGWVALNLARIETLITDDAAMEEVETETEAITGGSLAEAIVTGNVVAAYQMIAHRPMIALADAAADLDAVYRARKGEEVRVSNMLTTSAAAVSTENLKVAITALTGALDGTYDSEAEAVKMAIMKAVKAVS